MGMPDDLPLARFGEWAPDRASTVNPANEAKGVISQQNTYSPLASPQAIGANAKTAGTCIGVAGFYDASGSPHVFMGDSAKLYRIEGRTAVDRSKTGGYVATADRFWRFEQFGTRVYAVFPGVNTQAYDLALGVTQFADVAGAPQGEAIGRVREFLLIGNGQLLSWCAFNDPTVWAFSTALQSGSTTLEIPGGNIKCILGTETGAIFQERQISRLTYAGPPTVWQRDIVEKRRGAISQYGAVEFGRNIFYVSDDGFWVFDGYQSQPIGINKVDGYFTKRLNYPYRNRVCVAWDPINRALLCAFPANGSTTLNELLIYSLTDNRWSHDDFSAEIFGEMPLLGYNLDTLDTYPGANGIDQPSLGVLPIDSSVFTESRRQPCLTDFTHTLQVFSGVARPAILETQEFSTTGSRRGRISELWPLVEAPASALSASVVGRAKGPGDGVTESAVAGASSIGKCGVRYDARFLRARLYIAAGSAWDHAQGVYHNASPSGAR